MVFPSVSAVELFALASIALLLIPGPAVLYIVTQSAEQGRAAGLASVAGIHIGTLVHIVAAAVGLSALILASAVAFSVVKFGGAAYLVYLGVRKLLERTPAEEMEPRRAPLRRLFARGAVVNVLNPKTALSSSRSCRSSSTQIVALSGRRSSRSDLCSWRWDS